MNMDNFPE